MKVITIEIDVTLPDRIDNEDAADAIDHILDAGTADMAMEIDPNALPPVISQSIAEDCVDIDIGDARVVANVAKRYSQDKKTHAKRSF